MTKKPKKREVASFTNCGILGDVVVMLLVAVIAFVFDRYLVCTHYEWLSGCKDLMPLPPLIITPYPSS